MSVPIDAAWRMVMSQATAAHASRAPTITAPACFGRAETARGDAVCNGCVRQTSGTERERALAFVVELHPERLDARLCRPGDRQRRVRRMEYAHELRRRSKALRRVVLDVDRDVGADLHVVLVPAVTVLDRLLFDAEHLADQRREAGHRPSHLA